MGHPQLFWSSRKYKSRFPSGMTDRTARARAKTKQVLRLRYDHPNDEDLSLGARLRFAQDDNSVCIWTEKQKQGQEQDWHLRFPTLPRWNCGKDGAPTVVLVIEKMRKQIPFGNDRQKSKGKSKGKYKDNSRSFALLRMTRLAQDDNIRDAAVDLFVGTLCAQDDKACSGWQKCGLRRAAVGSGSTKW